MNKKVQKGEYGYRSALRKEQIIKVAIGAAAILLQLAARMLTDNQAAKNILTVIIRAMLVSGSGNILQRKGRRKRQKRYSAQCHFTAAVRFIHGFFSIV